MARLHRERARWLHRARWFPGLFSNMQSWITLALITFAIGLLFADHVYKAGSHGAIALQIFNTAMIIFSTAIASPDASSVSG